MAQPSGSYKLMSDIINYLMDIVMGKEETSEETEVSFMGYNFTLTADIETVAREYQFCKEYLEPNADFVNNFYDLAEQIRESEDYQSFAKSVYDMYKLCEQFPHCSYLFGNLAVNYGLFKGIWSNNLVYNQHVATHDNAFHRAIVFVWNTLEFLNNLEEGVSVEFPDIYSEYHQITPTPNENYPDSFYEPPEQMLPEYFDNFGYEIEEEDTIILRMWEKLKEDDAEENADFIPKIQEVATADEAVQKIQDWVRVFTHNFGETPSEDDSSFIFCGVTFEWSLNLSQHQQSIRIIRLIDSEIHFFQTVLNMVEQMKEAENHTDFSDTVLGLYNLAREKPDLAKYIANYGYLEYFESKAFETDSQGRKYTGIYPQTEFLAPFNCCQKFVWVALSNLHYLQHENAELPDLTEMHAEGLEDGPMPEKPFPLEKFHMGTSYHGIPEFWGKFWTNPDN